MFRTQICKGYVLIMVLIFLQLASLISLAMISAQFNNEKNLRFNRQKILTLNYAEKLLRTFNSTKSYPSACFLPPMNDGELTAKALTWWQSRQSCFGIVNGLTYYYVLEDLGVAHCTIIQSTQYSAHYLRVTLLLNAQHFPLMLQSGVASASNESSACQSPRQITEGRQSWTRLSY